MHAIENAAFVSVGRAVGFAGLALFCLVFGLSAEPVLAARTGGVLCLAITLVLLFYALRAPTRPYYRTELWLILPKDSRPPAAIAQQIVGQTLRAAYMWFGQQAAILTIVFFAASLVLPFLTATE